MDLRSSSVDKNLQPQNNISLRRMFTENKNEKYASVLNQQMIDDQPFKADFATEEEDEQPNVQETPSAKRSQDGNENTPIQDWIKGYDKYATPIGLTFNRKPKFTTAAGGVCSLISAIIIIAFLALKIITLVYYSSDTVANTIHYNFHPLNEIQ